VDAQPGLIADRAHALRTCPARAPDVDHGPIADMDQYAENARLLYPVAVTVKGYLESLPRTQWAQLYLDPPHRRVIAQVTHETSEVLAELRARVENPESVAVEQVRYSRAELDDWAEKIFAIEGLGLNAVGKGNANNRLDVSVEGDADEAWCRIAEVVDPCAFRVEGGGIGRPVPARLPLPWRTIRALPSSTSRTSPLMPGRDTAHLAESDVQAAGSTSLCRVASGCHSTGTLRMSSALSSSAVPAGKVAGSSKNDERAWSTTAGSTFQAEVLNFSPSKRSGFRVAE
jgi:hypothetical protein